MKEEALGIELLHLAGKEGPKKNCLVETLEDIHSPLEYSKGGGNSQTFPIPENVASSYLRRHLALPPQPMQDA